MVTFVLVVLLSSLTGPAFADATADVKAHEEAFARSCNAGDVQGVVGLYADDARLVWPGRGEEGKGKADVEKMVTNLCKGTKDLKLVLESVEAIPLDDAHVATLAHWADSFTRADGKHVSFKVRSTEVLVKSGGAWRYLVDHASVGLPPPAPPTGARRHRRER